MYPASVHLGTGGKPFCLYANGLRKFLPVTKYLFRIITYVQRQVQRSGNNITFPMQPGGTGCCKACLFEACKVPEPYVVL